MEIQMLTEKCSPYLPNKLEKDKLYLIFINEDETYPYALAFLCPCGCDEEVHISVDIDPERVRDCDSWQIESLDPFTISPSILRRSNCRTHMFIRNGNIQVL